MPLPPRRVLTLSEASNLWGITVAELGWHAVEGTLTPSMVITGVIAEIGEEVEVAAGRSSRRFHGQKTLTGLHDLIGADVWPAFKGGTAVVRRLKPSKPSGFVEFRQPANEVTVTAADLVIRFAECERVATTYGLARPEMVIAHQAVEPVRPPRTRGGALPGYEWDRIWVRVCTRIYDEGRPETQAELVNDVLDWLATSGGALPDASTVKKKISMLWREIGAQ